MRVFDRPVELRRNRAESGHFRDEFILGLSRQPKTISCKFLYDEEGSRLFDRICELEEYYPTRTETGILREHIEDISRLCGPACLLLEPGSGSSAKTRLLLDCLRAPVAYLPVDISREQLFQTAHSLKADYADLEILPVCADYTRLEKLPPIPHRARRRVVFFPGSTIGNFAPAEARVFLRRMARLSGPDGAMLIGIDLPKARAILERAYNDAEGVTAAFNLNLLARANRELDADFDLTRFRHRAIYDENHSRIEMHLVSLARQTAHCDGSSIDFAPGESIITEYSYKYSLLKFRGLAHEAGCRLRRAWTDARNWFAVLYLEPSG